MLLAQWQQGQARLSEAEKTYRRALALDAANTSILNNLGLVLQQRGRTAEAPRTDTSGPWASTGSLPPPT